MPNKLIQFSTTTCGPCTKATKFITEKFGPDESVYETVYLDKDDFKYKEVLHVVQINSVPTFVVLDESKNEISDVFRGLDVNRINEFFEDGEE